MSSDTTIMINRIYSKERAEGYQVLVDRLWPRGVTKAKARLDEWLKDIAPSAELRRWYGHQPDLFDEFKKRYRAELDTSPSAHQAVAHLLKAAHDRDVVLVTATKDVEHSGAQVLFDYVNKSREK